MFKRMQKKRNMKEKTKKDNDRNKRIRQKMGSPKMETIPRKRTQLRLSNAKERYNEIRSEKYPLHPSD